METTTATTDNRRGPKGPMTQEHKDALAAGRSESKIVREYLEALRAKAKPGRKQSPDSIQRRLTAIEQEFVGANAITELRLIQERLDLQRKLDEMPSTIDMPALEAKFIEVAFGYTARNGFSYTAWRTIGVEASVLKRAGINRVA